MKRITIIALVAVALATASAAQALGTSGVAVVDSDGTLARGTNATAAVRTATGTYIVTMNSDVHKCTFTATTGGSGQSGAPAAGFVTVAPRVGDATAVFVTTFNATGTSSDRGFHLNVRC